MSVSTTPAGSLVLDSVVRFLKEVPPFQFLPERELASVAREMSLDYFPRDTVILRAGAHASPSLFIIQKGGVKLALRTSVGKELVLDMRSEGEVFGVLSFLGRDVARLDAIAVEDTLCYTLPAEQAQQMIAEHPEVSDFFLRTSLTRYMDRSLRELREQTQLMGAGERLLYTLSAGEAAGHPALTCAPDTTVRDAAQAVAASRATCIFVQVPDRADVAGVVTDTDFTNKVVAVGRSLDSPITSIMSAPVIAVDGNQPVFEALLEMVTHDVQHLLVTENGRPKAVLTNHDLLLLQGKSPLSVSRNLEQQTTLDGLAAAHRRVADLLPLLLREGARAGHITRVVAQINGRVMTRILQFAEAEVGPPPVPYCWITFGSEGRYEQTFKTDQDNGLILSDEAANHHGAGEYFRRFADFCRQALERCGYPACPGGYMASNPQWRMTLGDWKAQFTKWVESATVREVQDAIIFFDMRASGGDAALFAALDAHLRALLQRGAFFKSVLAFVSLNMRPPLGFFRKLVLERGGEHKHQLDLKLAGTGPIVNVARIFTLDGAAGDRPMPVNTEDRLQALIASGAGDTALWKDLQDAFELLMMLRLELQLRQAREGRPLSSYVSPDSLTHLQRTLLKEAFQTAAHGQAAMEEKFRSAIWMQLQAGL
jgi:CBS domain-containing protein